MKMLFVALAFMLVQSGLASADGVKPAVMHEGTVSVYDNSMNGISQNEMQISGDAAKFIYDSVQGQIMKDAELPIWTKQVGNRTQCSFSPGAQSPYSCSIRIGNCAAADNVAGWPVDPKASCK